MKVKTTFFLAAALYILDQLVKVWAISELKEIGSTQLIPKLLRLTYVENYGAAFGILQGKRVLLVIVTLLVLGVLSYMVVSGKARTVAERLCVSLIIAGGLGNLTDRIFRGFVVDYLDVNEWLSFPIFNLADCCVVLGTVMLIVIILLSDIKQSRQKHGQKDDVA